MKQNKPALYATAILIILLFSLGCKKKNGPAHLPVVTTAAVSNIGLTTAVCGGTIEDDGGSDIIARGVCWSIKEEPSIDDSITTDGSGTGSFVSHINKLAQDKNYYVRAYATNSTGTGYGKAIRIYDLDSIWAGYYDNSFFYHEFSPPITPHVVMDSNMLTGRGQDTICLDFNTDSMRFDIYLVVPNPDSLNVIFQMDSFMVFMVDISSIDNGFFHCVEYEYYVGLGQTSKMDFISALRHNDLIYNYLKSPMKYDFTAPMWEHPTDPGMISGYYDGPWYSPASSARYIGFMYKRKLGWIKVDNSNPGLPKFISYAIQK